MITIVKCDAHWCESNKDNRCNRSELNMHERGVDVYVICGDTEALEKYK